MFSRNNPIDTTVHSGHIPGTSMVMPNTGRSSSRGPADSNRQPQPPSPSKAPSAAQMMLPPGEDLGELPPSWEAAYTPEGHLYFIE